MEGKRWLQHLEWIVGEGARHGNIRNGGLNDVLSAEDDLMTLSTNWGIPHFQAKPHQIKRQVKQITCPVT